LDIDSIIVDVHFSSEEELDGDEHVDDDEDDGCGVDDVIIGLDIET